jgi:hypothetical protein
VQLEQLRVAREKLLETLRDARRVVEDASRDLSTAEVEARLAAETAGRRVAGEAMPSTDELEAELFGGRYAVSPQILTEETVTQVVTDEVMTDVATGEVMTDVATDEVMTQILTDEVGDFVSAVVAVDVVVVATGLGVGHEEAAAESAATSVVAMDATDHGPELETQARTDVPVEDGSQSDRASGNDEPRVDVPALAANPVGVVDDLFARLRAERTQAADAARHVLASEVPPKVKKARAPRTSKSGPNPGDSADIGTPPIAGLTDDTVLVIDMTGDAEPEENQPDDAATTAGLGTDPKDIANLVAERLARSIKRHLRDEQGSALVALRTSRGLPSVDSIVGTDAEQHSRLSQVVERSLAEAGASLQPADLVPAVDDIVGDVRSSLATALSLVRAGSADAADLSEAIASAYRGWTTERLDALLRRVAPIAA